MTLQAPSYITVADISNMPVTYRWDDYDPYPLFPDLNEDTETLLAKMSDRAKFAFAIACAEWVVYRFIRLSGDPRPLQFIEACWAVEMSDRYETPDEFEDAEWEGPIRGPIDLALITILNTFYASEDGNAEADAAFAELVALHVLPDPSPYVFWRSAILPRLVHTYPYRKDNPFGEPVPREALDPKLDLNAIQRKQRVEAYLAGLQTTANPFLFRAGESDA